MPNRDPYVYPNTHTLINHFDIKDPEKLQELEGEFFAKNAKKPLPIGNFDYAHLKAIHYFFLVKYTLGLVKLEQSTSQKATAILVIHNILIRNSINYF